jgi:hypothetical protein
MDQVINATHNAKTVVNSRITEGTDAAVVQKS